MRNRNGQGCSCAGRIEQDQRFHLVWNLFQNTHVPSASGRNNRGERRFPQVPGWAGHKRLVQGLCGVVHTLKNRVARVFIPGSLFAVGSNKRNSHALPTGLPGARSTTRADERCTQLTIRDDRYWISETEGCFRNRFQGALATVRNFIFNWTGQTVRTKPPSRG